MRIKSAPKIRQVYLRSYPEDTIKPEFSKKRPVVVLSKRATLYGVATVLPMTTKEQRDERFAVEVCSPIDGRTSWIVCNHVHTMAVRRLEPPGKPIPRIRAEEFQDVLKKVYLNLPLPKQST